MEMKLMKQQKTVFRCSHLSDQEKPSKCARQVAPSYARNKGSGQEDNACAWRLFVTFSLLVSLTACLQLSLNNVELP